MATMNTVPGLEEVTEQTVKWVSKRPITFLEFLEMFGEDEDVELIDGTVEERMAVQYDHESLFAWLFSLLQLYVRSCGLGVVLGSRSAVEINPYRGRIPDILFIREERRNIIQQKAIFGAPDLVVEIVSPSDRPSHLIALETDFRSIGVPEIVFIDQHKRKMRTIRKRNGDYIDEELHEDVLRLESIAGFWVKAEWLYSEPRPDLLQTFRQLREESDSEV